MHYDDPYQIENNYFEFVMYVHEDIKPNSKYPEITSIRNCFLINPGILKRFLEDERFSRAIWDDMELEKFYFVRIRFTDNKPDAYEILVKDVIDDDNIDSTLFLH